MSQPISEAFRVAVIDVGSNSVRMMVAEVQGREIVVLERLRETTRLLSGIQDGMLSPESIAATAQAIAAFVEYARSLPCAVIRAFGTSAMRDARNREQLNDRCHALCGIRVELVSGKEEAQLAYEGALCTSVARNTAWERIGVMDIGGGSTELLCGARGVVIHAVSIQIGAVRMANALRNVVDPEAMLDAAKGVMLPFISSVRAATPVGWIGVGGTITSLAAMTKQVPRYTPEAIEGFPLSQARVHDWLQTLSVMPIEARKKIVGLSENRADIIPFGCAILLCAMRLLDIDVIYASDHDNLEGFIKKITNL